MMPHKRGQEWGKAVARRVTSKPLRGSLVYSVYLVYVVYFVGKGLG